MPAELVPFNVSTEIWGYVVYKPATVKLNTVFSSYPQNFDVLKRSIKLLKDNTKEYKQSMYCALSPSKMYYL